MEDEECFFSSSQRQHTPFPLQRPSDSPLLSPPGRLSSGGTNLSFGDDAYVRSKIFNDPVHGHIRIPGYCCEVIDTKHFQRLRDLKQLGTIYYVFYGACHNRFEHSIGTCHIAENVVERFYRDKKLRLDRSDVRAVSLAGLCHDLGHGPFSHVFEHEWYPAVSKMNNALNPEEPWSHETMSCKILDHMYENHHVDNNVIAEEDIERVKMLIKGEHYNDDKKFLAEIVANSRNSIDVDKFDYIERDCYYSGVKSGCDFKRLIEYMKVVNNHICFKASEANNLYNLFNTRANLHHTIYTHKKGKAVEYMIVDALLSAEPVLNLADKIHDVDEYLTLDDTLIKHIEISKDPGMREAQKIISRLRRRELYKYVDETVVPEAYMKRYQKITAEDILEHKFGGPEILPSDICVQNLKIDWSMKNQNPIDNVGFYRHYDDVESFEMPAEKVSTMLPRQFMVRKVRIFSKSRDEKIIDCINETFRNFVRARFKETDIKPTPQKRPRMRTTPQVQLKNIKRKILQ